MWHFCLILSLIVLHTFAYPQEKGKVVSDKEIDALSDKSDTAKAKVVNDGDVKLDYKGQNGWIKNKAGTGEATQEGRGDKFNAIGPDGKKATGTADKNKKIVNVKDAKGGKAEAQAVDEHLANVNVNGKDK